MPLFGFLKRFGRSRSGGLAVIVAVAFPPLALLICGAVDLATVMNDRDRFQTVADATALQAAPQVGIGDPTGISERDDAFARDQLKDLADRATYTVGTQIASDNGTVTVTIAGTRNSFFANLLPPGGWKISAEAKATTLNHTPLCVLSTGEDGLGDIKMDSTSLLTAQQCMVHSNQDIKVAQSAALKAGLVQSTGLASGNIYPAAQVGAPVVADPFGAVPLALQKGSLCLPVDQILTIGVHILPPGIHCGKLDVPKGVTVQLLPGEHYFMKGDLDLHDNAVIQGDDVVLVFDKDSKFHFKESASIDLAGRRGGPLAGFVIATTPKNNGTFEISSSSARKLLGTIYIPSAKLLVTGGQDKIADQSAWTVIVAKGIEMHGSPNLVVNANYLGSSVPVPKGVGPSTEVKLIR